MRQRSVVVCILLSMVTCGIYGMYWMAVLNDDLNNIAKRDGATSGGMVVLFSIITCGIYGLYWMYKMGETVETIHMERGEPNSSMPVACLLLGVFGLGVVAFALMQNQVNKYVPAV